jgi:hypothetical protein
VDIFSELGVSSLLDGDGGEEQVQVGLLFDIVVHEGGLKLGVICFWGAQDGVELGIGLHLLIRIIKTL